MKGECPSVIRTDVVGMATEGMPLGRAAEYRRRCREAKLRYHEEVVAHGDSEKAREWRRMELAALDRQYREGRPMTGCNVDL